MSTRPHVHAAFRSQVPVAPYTGDLPDPEPQHAEVTVDLRVYWPSRGTHADAEKVLARAIAVARAEMDDWFRIRDDRFWPPSAR